jgi:transcriptional regulator with XRE-family HTH domain
LGYTQEQLAEALDISYQQIQKYETAANRVSSGRLFQIAQRLEAPVGYFFEGMGVEFEIEASAGPNRATFELVRNFSMIIDPTVRNAVSSLVKSLANGQGVAASSNGGSTGHDSLNGNGGANGGGANGSGSQIHAPEDRHED